MALLALILFVPGHATAEPEPVWRYAPDRGFIDDCLAFDTHGHRLAFIHTDSSSFLHAVLLNTATPGIPQRLAQIPLDPERIVPRLLAFTPDDERLLLLFSDAKRSESGASLFGLDGRKINEIVGGEEIAVTSYGDQQVVSVASRKPKPDGGYQLSVALHDTVRLGAYKRASLTVGPDETTTIDGKKVRLLYWQRGSTGFVGLEPGRYDRERDVRLPDQRLRYDLIAGRVVTRERAQNPLVWRRSLAIRERHPPQTRVAHVTDDLQQLLLVTAQDRIEKLETARPWQLYEPKSLQQMERFDGSDLLLSLNVDPLNPAALARKKADPERAHFYRITPPKGMTLLGSVLVSKRNYAWSSAGSWIAYLRKLRGFARGGRVLELYTTTH
jgi:hypothetical protein